MNKILKVSLITAVLALIPFAYFYHRDLISSAQTDSFDGCTPYNLSWRRVEDRVHLSWQTKDKCIGYLRYGDDPQSLGSIAVDVEGSIRKSSHEVVIEDSKENYRYYATIYSGEKVYGQSGQPIVIKID